jgi:hypothetical protein
VSKKRETLLKERALKALRGIPHSHWEKIQQKSIRHTPDILGCRYGRAVAIELKDEAGRLAPGQGYCLAQWATAGALVIIMTQKTMQKDLELIRQITDNSL